MAKTIEDFFNLPVWEGSDPIPRKRPMPIMGDDLIFATDKEGVGWFSFEIDGVEYRRVFSGIFPI